MSEIVAEHLDGKIRFDSGNRFVDAHRHRLREVVGDAGNACPAPSSTAAISSSLRVESRPRFYGTQQQIGVAFVDSHRLGCEVRPADLDDHVGDLGKLPQALLDSSC